MSRENNARWTILLIIAAIVTIVILAGLIVSKVFVVRSVAIEGDVEDEDALIRSAKLTFGGSIFFLDANEIEENVQSTGTYVLEEMSVKYPSTVILTIRQRTQDAIILNGGQYLVLDSEGYVVSRQSTMPEDAGVYVYGLNATSYSIGCRISAPESRLTAMQTVLEALRTMSASDYISELNVENVDALTMTSSTGITIELGNADNMESKIAWTVAALDDLNSRGNTSGTLDVSSGTKADYLAG